MSNLDLQDLDNYLQKTPKLIHQIWLGTIPNKNKAKKAYKKLKLYRDSWVLKNPDWKIIEWNKPMCIYLVKNFYPEHMEMFSGYPHEIQRCDAIRYLILHRYGGWYADMDYYCNRTLNEAMSVYKNDIYFVQSPNGVSLQDVDHISNSLMYSVKGHSFWKQVMLELEKSQKTPYYYPRHLTVMFTTGPGILNRLYSRYKFKYKIKSLPWRLFHPYGIGDDKASLSANKEVYAIHIGKGSWEQKDSHIFLFFYKDWLIILFILLLPLLSLIYFLWKKKL